VELIKEASPPTLSKREGDCMFCSLGGNTSLSHIERVGKEVKSRLNEKINF